MAGITTLVYWIGNIGIPGKGANWSEPYNPDRTIGELIQTMVSNRCGDANKRIEILKHDRDKDLFRKMLDADKKNFVITCTDRLNRRHCNHCALHC